MTSPSRLSRYDNSDEVSIQKTSLETTNANFMVPSKVLKQCRICLQDETQSTHKSFIIPCKCIGSVKYIHEQCIRTWINSALKTKTREERQKIKSNGIQCQMCKYLIKFQIDMKHGCNSCSEIFADIQKKAILFTIVVILFFVAGGGLGFSIYSVLANISMFSNKNGVPFEIILALCGGILLFLFFCLGGYTLINEFCIKIEFKIGKIAEIKEKLYRSTNQIMPIQDISQQQIQMINAT